MTKSAHLPLPDQDSEELLAQLSRRLQRTLPMAHIKQRLLDGCDGLSLGLINDDFPTGPLPADVMRDVVAEPAYWAFCWGSGLGLAQLLYQHPEWVAGKVVLDLGSGSGVIGIAAARNGASMLIACDNDPDALVATAINARLNNVSLTLLDELNQLQGPVDLILMADVLYDRSNLPLLDAACALAPSVLVADSRIRTSPHPDFKEIRQVAALTTPNLGEFDEFGTVRLFLRGAL